MVYTLESGEWKTVASSSARSDPRAEGNRHKIHAVGRFGEIDVSILGKTLPENPKTSVLAPFSLLRSVMNLTSTLVVG